LKQVRGRSRLEMSRTGFGVVASKLRGGYRLAASRVFKVILLFVVMNVVVAAGFLMRDLFPALVGAVDPRVSADRQKFVDLEAYARIPAATANRFLDEQDAMTSAGFRYEPWLQFRHPEVHGTLLNTDAEGFRRTMEPRRAKGRLTRIYVFGGSTTFGYGVPDAHTIPSYMQSILEERHPDRSFLVKNYGQGFYFSSQEMLLFLTRLKHGDVPDVAVFIDGANDTAQLAPGRDEPWFTPTVRALWDARRGALSLRVQRDLMWIPVVRLANGVATRVAGGASDPNAPENRMIVSDRGFAEEEIARIAEYVVSNYRNNMRVIRALCKEYDVTCRFIWQPWLAYKYQGSLHRKFPFKDSVPRYWSAVYSRMSEYRAPDFLYLGDMLENVAEKVFVDAVHYNEVLNEGIAARICDVIRLE
jgi:hypothetical protein